jgi:hypothetical protein
MDGKSIGGVEIVLLFSEAQAVVNLLRDLPITMLVSTHDMILSTNTHLVTKL